MFQLHSTFAIQLLALVAAAALLGWAGYAHVHAKKLVKAIAYSVIVLSVLSLICTAYYGVKYNRAGYFETPTGMRHAMMPKSMMESMMGGMMKKDKMNDDDAASESENHSHDHDQ
jgi:hypothetical protein